MKPEYWIACYCLIGFCFLFLLPIVFHDGDLTPDNYIVMGALWPGFLAVCAVCLVISTYERYCEACKQMVLPHDEDTEERLLRPVNKVD